MAAATPRLPCCTRASCRCTASRCSAGRTGSPTASPSACSTSSTCPGQPTPSSWGHSEEGVRTVLTLLFSICCCCCCCIFAADVATIAVVATAAVIVAAATVADFAVDVFVVAVAVVAVAVAAAAAAAVSVDVTGKKPFVFSCFFLSCLPEDSNAPSLLPPSLLGQQQPQEGLSLRSVPGRDPERVRAGHVRVQQVPAGVPPPRSDRVCGQDRQPSHHVLGAPGETKKKSLFE